MQQNIVREVEALDRMSVPELREKYHEVFGEEARSTHKDFLRKRIAWRLQANEEGGLSGRALRRAKELANDADLRLLAPAARTVIRPFRPSHDRRLPMPGTVLQREYHGQTVTVTVLDTGFEYAGQVFTSLSAVARAITGTRWNGYLFFGIAGKGGKP